MNPVMNLKNTQSLPRTIHLLGCLLICGQIAAQNATIRYVGSQMDIESDADTPDSGWRNVTPAKPLDIDGDNILGTDGWYLHFTKSVPAFVSITKTSPNTNGHPEWGVLDNPKNPSGKDDVFLAAFHDANVGVDEPSAPLIKLEIKGNELVGKTLRLGVLHDVVGDGTATYTLKQTVGGSAVATTPVLPHDGASLDVSFFDISGAVDGDTFVVISTTLSGEKQRGFEQVAGITFDIGASTITGDGIADTINESNTYTDWIAGFEGLDDRTTFTDDADGDGILNGVEYFFGTHPGEVSQGLVFGTATGDTFAFTHPLNNSLATDISAEYRWSNDGTNFHASGATAQGTTVSFSQSTLSDGITTITATITGNPVDQLFVDVEVVRN